MAALSFMGACKKDIVWVPDDFGAELVKKPEGPYIADKSFKSVAYAYHNANIATFDTAKLQYITHLHFAFLTPKDDGTLQTLTNHGNFEKLNTLAHDNKVKTAISIQGDEVLFRTLAANEQTRKRLVKSLVDFAVRYQLDGVDLDWEYPRANYGSDVAFEVFAQELAAELHSWHKYLSMAVTPGLYAGPVKDGITKGAMEALDFVNLMAYDAKGIDLDDPNHHSTYLIAQKTLDVWLDDKGLSPEKAVLGVPLYGKNVDNLAMSYISLVKAGADPNADMFVTSGKAYYYNGVKTMRAKAALAKQRANGIMFWEFGQDDLGQNSLIKAAFDALK